MSVTVRFAPSPTGFLHVGNARTALLNWLFARREGGRFLLRLDDTDIERSRPEFAAAILDDLDWLGLSHDLIVRQSERMALYAEAAASLRASGRLYPCYETAEELEAKRRRQRARGLPPVYDRAALRLGPEDRAAYERQGRRPHWRFLLEHEAVAWADLIHGPVRIDAGSLSDPVLLREDERPLYTLSSVVDDRDFAISHVIRGADHLANTAVQIQLFRALGGVPPVFAHHSLLVGPRGEELSKRLGSFALRDLRADGTEPLALASLLARLGSADPVVVRTSLDALAVEFGLARFGRAPARFDPAELQVLNARLLAELPYAAVRARLEALGAEGGPDFWAAVQSNLRRIEDAAEWWRVIEGPIVPVIEEAGFAREAAALLPQGEWGTETWAEWTGRLKAASGRKGRDLFRPLRLALTGREHGPEMKNLLPLIGPERARARLLGEAA
jgi:glutamyl-tRNA synthetase